MRTRDEILLERRSLLRSNRFLKDDVHAGADRMLAATAAQVQEQLAGPGAVAMYLLGETPDRRTPHGAGMLDLAAAWAIVQPQFAKMIHEAIDRSPAPVLDHQWSPLTRAQLDKRVAALDQELVEIEREGKRREILERKAEVDAELKALKD